MLVVKAEHRSAIPGIIHGSSGSGASLYLEPLSTVEINNEIVALEQQEREEVHRILRQLTDAFRIEAGRAAAGGRRGHRARRHSGEGAVRAPHLGRRAGAIAPTAGSSCGPRAIRC